MFSDGARVPSQAATRRHAGRTVLWLSATVLVLAVYPRSAYAYLDVGTGSLVLQTLVASVAAGLFTLKVYWNQVKARFTRAEESGEGSPGSAKGDDE